MTKLPTEMRARQHLPAAYPQHHQERHADQRLQQRLEQALHAHQPDVLRDVRPVQFLEAAHLGLLLHEGADHAHAGEVLLHAAGDIGEHRLDLLEAVVNDAAEEDHGEAHRRAPASRRTAPGANRRAS